MSFPFRPWRPGPAGRNAKRGAGDPDSPLELCRFRIGDLPDPENVWIRLFGGGLYGRHDVHVGSVVLFGGELHRPADRREQGVVAAHAAIHARPELGAALTDDDVAGEHLLTAELLHAETLTGRVAPVARGAARFLVSHERSPRTLDLTLP